MHVRLTTQNRAIDVIGATVPWEAGTMDDLINSQVCFIILTIVASVVADTTTGSKNGD